VGKLLSDFEIAIVGGGMAGASLAAELAAHMSVIILEAEDQPGYHATGRSAAFWSETYGGPLVQPLTTASGPFLAQPPSAIAARGFLSPRGSVHLGRRIDADKLDTVIDAYAGSPIKLERMTQTELAIRIPGLRPEWCLGAWEQGCADIDVAALHGLSGLRAALWRASFLQYAGVGNHS